MKEKNNVYMKIDLLGNIYIKDIIIYYDKPLVFSCINDLNQYFIASCNRIEEMEEWIFLPLTKARLIQGLKGNITAYKLFKEPECNFLWKVTISSRNYNLGKAIQIFPYQLSDEDLPDEDITYDIYGEEEFSIKDEERVKILNDSIMERREIIDISLESKDSHIHEIEAVVLGKILDNTQTIINLIGHKKGLNAQIPRDIKEKNKLVVAGNYAASFGIRLKSDKLTNILNESDLQESINIFMDMLEAKSDIVKLTDIFKKENPALSIHYKKLLKLLSQEEIAIKTYCAFPSNKYRKSFLSKHDIRTSLKSLEEDIKEVKKYVELKGELVAVDTTKKTFKFISKEEKIQGVIDEYVKIEEYVLPREVEVSLEMITKLNDITRKEKISYKLLDLKYL